MLFLRTFFITGYVLVSLGIWSFIGLMLRHLVFGTPIYTWP